MKTRITNLMKYILKHYPHKADLSTSRLTKMLYLADWKSALENSKQITDVVWHFNHYGPYVDDFMKIARDDENIIVKNTNTIFGGCKQQVELHADLKEDIDILETDKKILDFVIEATKSKNYEDFIRLVYSTYPVVTRSRYSDLDLVKMAVEYKDIAGNLSQKSC